MKNKSKTQKSNVDSQDGLHPLQIYVRLFFGSSFKFFVFLFNVYEFILKIINTEISYFASKKILLAFYQFFIIDFSTPLPFVIFGMLMVLASILIYESREDICLL